MTAPTRLERDLKEFQGTTVWEVAKEFFTKARRSPAESVRIFLGETIWHWDLASMRSANRLALIVLRMVYLVGRGFVSSRAMQQAKALTYTTMLALVPAFAMVIAVFSMSGLEGLQRALQAFAVNALAASPDQEMRISQGINDLVFNMQGTAGGVAGVAFFVFLLFTIISLLSTLEKTLNEIWAIKRGRSFINKFMTYWCIATLGPIFLGAALVQGSQLGNRFEQLATEAKTASAHWLEGETEGAEEPGEGDAEDGDEDEGGFAFPGVGGEFAAAFEEEQDSAEGSEAQDLESTALERITQGYAEAGPDYISFLISLVLTILTFTLLYAFLPNTRVRLKPALIGAVTAALLWAATKWGLALSSSTLVKYNAVYGGLATIPITMFWLYLTWLIVILGAELTFAIQNIKSQRREELSSETSQVFNELVALRLVAAIAVAFERGEQPPDHVALEEVTGAPLTLCQSLLFHLSEDGLLREIDLQGDITGYVPARPMDRITVSDVIASLRERRGISFELREGPDLTLLQAQLGRASDAAEALSGRITLRELVRVLESGGDLTEQPARVSVVANSAIANAKSTDLRGSSGASLKVADLRADTVAPPSEADAAAEPTPTEADAALASSALPEGGDA